MSNLSAEEYKSFEGIKHIRVKWNGILECP
jgi:hypothetical protein